MDEDFEQLCEEIQESRKKRGVFYHPHLSFMKSHKLFIKKKVAEIKCVHKWIASFPM